MSVGTVPQFPGYLARSGFRRITVPEFHKLIDTGFLSEDDPIQLLEGHMVPKLPPNPPHSNTIGNAGDTIGSSLPAGWRERREQPVVLADSQPAPDVVVVRGDRTTYRHRHPVATDIGLVVEVADSSLSVDRIDMGRIYARANLPIYWIINIVDCQVEVYTDPQPRDAVPSYVTRTDYKVGHVVPLVLDGQVVASIPVADLLG